MPSLPITKEPLDTDDIDLMARVQKGDVEAFASLVNKYSQKLYSMAYRMIANQSEAEDIVQDSFVKLWTHPEKWNKRKNAKFSTWFYRLVINACIDYSRKKKINQLSENFDVASNTNLEENYDLHLQQIQLEKCLQALPTNQRIALNLCFYEGLSNKEAAEIMKLNLKALQSLIMRAKEKLKKEMKL